MYDVPTLCRGLGGGGGGGGEGQREKETEEGEEKERESSNKVIYVQHRNHEGGYKNVLDLC